MRSLLILLSFFIGPSVFASDAVTALSDQVYRSVAGVDLKLDLFRPGGQAKSEEKRPAVVLIHGGCFREGVGKSDVEAEARDLAADGFVVASIDYRVAPKFHYPAAQQDVQQAVRWLRASADELGIDPNRIGAVGFSAGGTLATFLGVQALPSAETGMLDSKSEPVKAVVDFFGRMDFTATQSTGEDCAEVYLGKKRVNEPEAFKRASPLYWIGNSACFASSSLPSVLIFHGTKDEQVPIFHSEKLIEALSQWGARVELLRIEGEGHGFQDEKGTDAWRRARSFLRRELGG